MDHAVVWTVSGRLPTGSGHVGFVVDKAALGQASRSASVSLAKHFTDCSTLILIHLHRSWYNRTAVDSVIVDSVSLHKN
jgi:hypothetical protein